MKIKGWIAKTRKAKEMRKGWAPCGLGAAWPGLGASCGVIVWQCASGQKLSVFQSALTWREQRNPWATACFSSPPSVLSKQILSNYRIIEWLRLEGTSSLEGDLYHFAILWLLCIGCFISHFNIVLNSILDQLYAFIILRHLKQAFNLQRNPWNSLLRSGLVIVFCGLRRKGRVWNDLSGVERFFSQLGTQTWCKAQTVRESATLFKLWVQKW